MKKTLALAFAVVAAGMVAAAGSAGSTGPTERSGALHVTKTCPDYHGLAGDACTITSSNINAIKPGSRVVYTSAANFVTGALDSDLIIDGPGSNTAFGHVVLDLSTLTGVVTFSGGTGEFRHFHAGPLVVACPAFPDCSWDGPYSFRPQG
jgi:hypothetical protein